MNGELSPTGRTALDAVRGGRVVTPLRSSPPPGVKPGSPENWRKSPYIFEWQLEANGIRTEAQVRRVWDAHPSAGVGLVHQHSNTGSVDIDNPQAAAELLQSHEIDLYDDILRRGVAIVGRPDRAKVLFRIDSPPRTVKLGEDLAAGIPAALELRGSGGQDVLPPSLHPLGFRYAWAAPIDFANLPEAPVALVELWKRLAQSGQPVRRARGGRTVSRGDEAPVDVPNLMIHGAPEGSRNREIFRALCALRREGATPDELRVVGEIIADRCNPPLPLREVASIVKSAAGYDPQVRP